MAFYPTIQELIDSVKDMEISYRKLHTNICIKNKDEYIKIPYDSVVRQYMPYFEDTVVTAQLIPDEIVLYRYKPKRLSYDLYGTTELWSAILELNHMVSVLDFDLVEQPRLFVPKEFLKTLNEIMIIENII